MRIESDYKIVKETRDGRKVVVQLFHGPRVIARIAARQRQKSAAAGESYYEKWAGNLVVIE